MAMRRAFATVVLAAMVVLAGCGTGVLDGSSPTGESSRPTTAGGSSAATTPTYPPGASESGISNVSKLGTAGVQTLRNASYTFRYEAVETFPNASTRVRTFTGESDGDRQFAASRSVPHGAGNYSVWDGPDDGVTFLDVRSGSPRYLHYAASHYRSDVYANVSTLVYVSVVWDLLRAFEYGVAETYAEDGHGYVVYESTGINWSYVSRPGTENYTASTLTVTIRDDGVVTAVDGTTERTVDGRIHGTVLDLDVRLPDDVTVRRPKWVEQVPRLDSSTLAGGRVIEISHEGGPTVENGTLYVHRGRTVLGTVTIASLQPGETVYVYRSGDGNADRLRVVRSKPSPGPEADDFTTGETVRIVLATDSATVGDDAYRNGTT